MSCGKRAEVAQETGDWGLGTQRPLSASLGIGDWGLGKSFCEK
ncbi:MAG: hypothetical protein ACFKPT_09445 [Gloeotrichia echinulata GP01]